MEELALLAVTAHPGDELAIAGTLARYAEGGVHVTLACTTGSEARGPGTRAEHGLRCVCTRLGLNGPLFLGYQASIDQTQDPRALVRAPACDVVRRLVGLVRRLRPQVLVTFGPDGLDGQADHVATGALAAQAFGAAGDLAQFPRDGGPEPYLPAKLFYFGLPDGLLRLAGLPGPATPEEDVSIREDVSQFVERKLDAARCYEADVEPHLVQLYALTPPERQHLLSVEYFTLALPQPAVADRRDCQLFAGIP